MSSTRPERDLVLLDLERAGEDDVLGDEGPVKAKVPDRVGLGVSVGRVGGRSDSATSAKLSHVGVGIPHRRALSQHGRPGAVRRYQVGSSASVPAGETRIRSDRDTSLPLGPRYAWIGRLRLVIAR